MEEWRLTKIGSICKKVCSGGTPKSTMKEYYDGGIPWLNTKEVHFNRIYSTESTISENGLNNSAAKWIEANAVIIAMYGATAAKCAIGMIPMTTNQACCNLMIDEKKADYRFVYYAIENSYSILASLANGGAQQNLNAQVIKDFEILLPSLDIQKRIGDVLSTLDDKIDVNKRINDNFVVKLLVKLFIKWVFYTLINDNLEQQAQALFKSWFVDFEPFRDGEFEESELGLIPKGWRVGMLSDVANVTMGTSPAGSSYNVTGEGDVFYQGRAEFGFRFPSRNMYTTEAKRFAEIDSVLLSVRAPVGDINVAEERCCIGRGLASVQSKTGNNSFMLYLMQDLRPVFDRFNGEGTVFGCINKKALEDLTILIPDKETMAKFDDVCSKMDGQIKTLDQESRRLAQLRDTLLPRLMSGEIIINEIRVG